MWAAGKDAHTRLHARACATKGILMSGSKETGSTDGSIGRPTPWKEGRYEQRGKPVDKSVVTPGGAAAESRDNVSTPVTRKDYEGTEPPSSETRGRP